MQQTDVENACGNESYQIDPGMKILRDVITFEGLSVHSDEFGCEGKAEESLNSSRYRNTKYAKIDVSKIRIPM